MLLGRDRDIALALNLILSGNSVDVVGGRSSGRTAFVRELSTRLEQLGWSVTRLRGVASLRQHPLAALQLVGLTAPNEQRIGLLRSFAELLEKRLAAPRSVVVVDDWDDLDESSWGIVEGVRRSLAVPAVVSRLEERGARHTPSGQESSTLEPAFVIEMSPLRFDDLEAVIAAELGGPVELSTISRIYAKSAGVVGLALAIATVAVQEGRLREVDGVWSAARDLWSSGLRGIVEAHLEHLGPDAKDALELIGLVGGADIDTIRKLVDWPLLELLEQRGMIQLVSSGSRQLVSVVPPLLVEFYRHEPLAVRRMRLIAFVDAKLGSDKGSITPQRPPEAPEQDAALVRLVQERARTGHIVARAQWEASPDPATALDYLQALMAVAAPADMIEHVISTTDPGTGDALSRAQYAVLRARWRAAATASLEMGLAELRAHGDALGDYGGIVRAGEVTLTCEWAAIPEDYADRLEVKEDMPDPVRAALWDAQLLVLVMLGRCSDALRVYAMYEADRRAGALMAPETRALHTTALMGAGFPSQAVPRAMRDMDEALGLLDVGAARSHGAVAALCQLAAGDNDVVDELVGTLFAAGPFPPTAAGQRQMLLSTAAVAAIRRGNVGTGESYIRELNAMNAPDGLLPAQSRSFAGAQIHAFNGQLGRAAEMLWEDGKRLWERGGRYAGTISMLNSCELVPRRNRLPQVVEAVAAQDSPLLQAHLAFVKALIEEDPDQLEQAFPLLRSTGRNGLAIAALRHAVRLHTAAGDDTRAVAAEAALNDYVRGLPHRRFDVDRFLSSAVALTEREEEVAGLVAAGLTNPEIANQLVVSVRTVESHMHRIIRKLNVANRQGLKDYIDGRAAGGLP
ncbi:LuxR C-terminal-related transcriptional regulator [Microbacterium sp. NPDC057407]|uniref:helix-turn-helix transcriptional regulator n=1 Tax=Microbacterium sp. NPDC057407 TaxID=3346120 RepID=UPI00366F7A4B